jgi:hypothetical protein
MRKLLVIILTLTLSGCAGLTGLIPSFWDDNQSRKIIDLRQSVEAIDCSLPQRPQAEQVVREAEWFDLYSESKGSRQADVRRIIKPILDTAHDWQKRSQVQEGSRAYCLLKKQVLQTQTKRAAEAVLGRF